MINELWANVDCRGHNGNYGAAYVSAYKAVVDAGFTGTRTDLSAEFFAPTADPSTWLNTSSSSNASYQSCAGTAKLNDGNGGILLTLRQGLFRHSSFTAIADDPTYVPLGVSGSSRLASRMPVGLWDKFIEIVAAYLKMAMAAGINTDRLFLSLFNEPFYTVKAAVKSDTVGAAGAAINSTSIPINGGVNFYNAQNCKAVIIGNPGSELYLRITSASNTSQITVDTSAPHGKSVSRAILAGEPIRSADYVVLNGNAVADVVGWTIRTGAGIGATSINTGFTPTSWTEDGMNGLLIGDPGKEIAVPFTSLSNPGASTATFAISPLPRTVLAGERVCPCWILPNGNYTLIDTPMRAFADYFFPIIKALVPNVQIVSESLAGETGWDTANLPAHHYYKCKSIYNNNKSYWDSIDYISYNLYRNFNNDDAVARYDLLAMANEVEKQGKYLIEKTMAFSGSKKFMFTECGFSTNDSGQNRNVRPINSFGRYWLNHRAQTLLSKLPNVGCACYYKIQSSSSSEDADKTQNYAFVDSLGNALSGVSFYGYKNGKNYLTSTIPTGYTNAGVSWSTINGSINTLTIPSTDFSSPSS